MYFFFFRLGKPLSVLLRLPSRCCDQSPGILVALLSVLVHVPDMQPLFLKLSGFLR